MGGRIWVPPYYRDPSRDTAGVGFLALSPYFKIRDPSRVTAGVALRNGTIGLSSNTPSLPIWPTPR